MRAAAVTPGRFGAIDYQGQRVRMVDYDTPEIGEAKCSSEYALGQKAKHRLLEILNSGPSR